MIMKYLERVADQMLKDRLEAFGAVLIEGPKWLTCKVPCLSYPKIL